MKKLVSAALLSAACMSANAAVVFSDNFDNEAGAAGVSQLNYSSFANWTVTSGTVDVVANTNPWGIQCAGNAGKCVDMDGSSGQAGSLESNVFSLASGDYTLSFDISGNQRNHNSDGMLVQLGAIFDSFSIFDNIILNANAPWETRTYDFTVNSATSSSLSFNHFGGDNIGIMLDNVVIQTKAENPATPVSEPASLALLGFGLLGLGAARRKQKQA